LCGRVARPEVSEPGPFDRLVGAPSSRLDSSLVTVFTIPSCFPCKLTIKSLTELGIAHEIRDVSTDPAAFEVVKSLGYSAAPVVVAPDGSHWQGLDPDKIKALVK